MIIVILLMAALVLLAESSVIAPFIYALLVFRSRQRDYERFLAGVEAYLGRLEGSCS